MQSSETGLIHIIIIPNVKHIKIKVSTRHLLVKLNNSLVTAWATRGNGRPVIIRRLDKSRGSQLTTILVPPSWYQLWKAKNGLMKSWWQLLVIELACEEYDKFDARMARLAKHCLVGNTKKDVDKTVTKFLLFVPFSSIWPQSWSHKQWCYQSVSMCFIYFPPEK